MQLLIRRARIGQALGSRTGPRRLTERRAHLEFANGFAPGELALFHVETLDTSGQIWGAKLKAIEHAPPLQLREMILSGLLRASLLGRIGRTTQRPTSNQAEYQGKKSTKGALCPQPLHTSSFRVRVATSAYEAKTSNALLAANRITARVELRTGRGAYVTGITGA